MRHYFCHVYAVYLSLQFSKKLFFRIRTLLSFSVYKIIITFAPSAVQNGQKLIFYCRIIINNVVLTHIFANHFAKVSQLLQKLLVALHCTLLLPHFLLFIFQFILHSSLIYFVPTQIFINIAAINIMNEFLHYSCSLTAPLACVMCSIIYKKDIFDKAIDSLCTQNTHHRALYIVH